MKTTSLIAAAAGIFLVGTPAAPAELEKFTLASTFIGECTACFFARDKGFYAKHGIDMKIDVFEDTVDSGLLGKTFDAHNFTSTAIAAMNQDRVCVKGIAPFVSFPQAIVGKVPAEALERERQSAASGKPMTQAEIEENRLKAIDAVLVYRNPSTTAIAVSDVFRAVGKNVRLIETGEFTGGRVRRLLRDGTGVATHASNPHATVLRGTDEVQTIVGMRSPRMPQFILSALYVRCEDVAAGSSTRARLEKVVRAILEAGAYMRDPAHRGEVVAWLQEVWLKRQHDKVGSNFEGMPVHSMGNANEPMSLAELSEEVYQTVVWSILDTWPSKEVRDRTVNYALDGRVRKNPDEFFDLSFIR